MHLKHHRLVKHLFQTTRTQHQPAPTNTHLWELPICDVRIIVHNCRTQHSTEQFW